MIVARHNADCGVLQSHTCARARPRQSAIARPVRRSWRPVACVAIFFGLIGNACGQTVRDDARPAGVSDTPLTFSRSDVEFDYIRRVEMVPMRDGARLRTVILLPRNIHHAPLLLTRTPYDADRHAANNASTHLRSLLVGADAVADTPDGDRYIRVIQDIRGKHGSEGDYVVTRPLRGPLNPTETDHSTDTFDTIEWLIKNVPETNGRVGIIGISYEGFLALMALVNPHPALKFCVAINPMVDGWMGDDFFHNGAFRQSNIPWIYEQVGTRSSDERWPISFGDDYGFFLSRVNAGNVGNAFGMNSLGFWKHIVEHPAYDGFWRQQAVDHVLEAHPSAVPVLLVHSLFDQEDIYGATAAYSAIKHSRDPSIATYLAIGPWHHGGMLGNGSNLGPLNFGQDTARHFREEILAPLLRRYLIHDRGEPIGPRVFAFQTGTNQWSERQEWPPANAHPTKLYLHDAGSVSTDAPTAIDHSFTSYTSDPNRPATYRERPIRSAYMPNSTWDQWLTDDQRFAEARSDVLTFRSTVLRDPVAIAGNPRARIWESTSGTDTDVVVKLIDEYPDDVPGASELGGYQSPVSMDIFRGRYRESIESPRAIPAGVPEPYELRLPLAHHVFLPGHRIVVQIQSAWFPLYDRNPQRFVENIFFARPQDYNNATIRVFHSVDRQSYVELPIVRGTTPTNGSSAQEAEEADAPVVVR